MKKKNTPAELPGTQQLEAELAREKYKHRYHSVLRSTIYTLIIVAAVAVRSNKLHTAYRIAKEKVEEATTAADVEAVTFEV